MMRIKTYTIALLFLCCSFPTFATPASPQQVDQLIQFEHWNELKSALRKHSMPNMKSATEELMFNQLQTSQSISAEQQALIVQISDIMVNDMIEQIDEKQLIKNIRSAYQNLDQQQAAALIQFYHQPNMQNAGKNVPIMIAHMIDSSSNDFNKIMELEEIKSIIQESRRP